ncbi:hypothetical protein, partial [Desulfovibrio sp. TomC]|uniref:hypothetical protein n=1 Tax=Desulfovibrio sp. TomC TaxID=1562888 RepID=UPI001E30BE6B
GFRFLPDFSRSVPILLVHLLIHWSKVHVPAFSGVVKRDDSQSSSIVCAENRQINHFQKVQ